MKIGIGIDKITKQQVILNTDSLVNAHGLLLGGSGSGKTHTIRGLARSLVHTPSGRAIIFDVHGDIFPNSPDVSSVLISETSRMGLQPFVVNRDKEFGGVAKAIKRFILAINKTTTKLGVKQEGVLRKLLEDLYRKNGFYIDNEKTWGLDYDPWPERKYPKRYPTFEDLLRFAKSKQKDIFLGMDNSSTHKLEEFIKKSAALTKKRVKAEKYDEEQMNEAKDAAIEAYDKFLSSSNDEKVVEDLMKYASKDVMDSLITRLESLHFTGIFKNTAIMFDPSCSIHRYDISTLDEEEQKIFIDLAMNELFIKAKENGFGGKTNTFIFIDEVRNFLDDSEGNIIRKFYNESRKFGVGVFCGGQDIKHFHDDIITNSATKIILGVDNMYSKAMSKRLQIPHDNIKNIVPKKSILLEMKTSEKKSGFREVLLPS